MSDNGAVLACRGLSKRYSEGQHQLTVLQDLDFKLFNGERVAIVGTSGSGKTTLLNMLGGLDLPTHGNVFVSGQDITTMTEQQRGIMRNQQMGFVYQAHHLLAEFTALENVCMPLLLRKLAKKEVRQRAQAMLQAVGLGERLAHKPAELSGGERQRVAIARALVTQPACVLMDEPTGNLDVHTGADVQALMLDLNKQFDTSFVVVTHDLVLAKKMDRVLTLRDGALHTLAEPNHVG